MRRGCRSHAWGLREEAGRDLEPSSAGSRAGWLLAALVVLSILLPVAESRADARSSVRCPAGAVPLAGGLARVGTSAVQGFDADEVPIRSFQLRPYCLDRTEVTVRAYEECARAHACPPVRPAFSGQELPMTRVTWSEARAFCRHRGGRLPTEMEWEHAARGHDDRLYPWGSARPDCSLADFWHETDGSCGGFGPSPVGSHPRGVAPSGALDMAGNVLEWVEDVYDVRGWSTLPPQDPVRRSGVDHGFGVPRVVRGGSWDYDVAHGLRVSDRGRYLPDMREPTVGFRCAYEPL